MTTTPDDLFERYESQYVRDLSGRLIRVEAATQKDLETLVNVSIDGFPVKGIPKARPATDDQGNIRRDQDGYIIPRLTTVHDAATWCYSNQETKRTFPGPDPSNPIPVLCHQNHLRPIGVCRVCSVLTTRNGAAGGRLIPACQHPLVDGMEVHTVASEVEITLPQKKKIKAGEHLQETVKVLLELLAANSLHEYQPDNDRRYNNELLSLLDRFEVPVKKTDRQLQVETRFKRRPLDMAPGKIDDSSEVIRFDQNNCILCDRCVRGCSEVKPFKIIGHTGFGNKAHISFDLGQPMAESGCVSCGECAVSCPTGALTFKGSIYTNTKTPRDPWKDEPVKPRTVTAEELERHPLFAGVPYAFLKWNEGAVGRLDLKPGQLICEQGKYGSTAFLIEKGGVDIELNGRQVATLGKTDVIVGEMACLSHQPRAASMRSSKEGATVIVVKRNMLHMLQRNAGARNILGPIYRRRALDNYLKNGRLFSGLSPEQSKASLEFLKNRDDVMLTQVDPGQAVFLQGSPADCFYIIYLGNVSVSETNSQGHSTVLNYLGPGRQFGEIGLLSDPEVSPKVAAQIPANQRGRRTANCTALDHVELVTIPRTAFLALTEAYPDVRTHLEKAALDMVSTNTSKRFEVRPLLGSFTQAGLHQGQSLLVLDLTKCTRCQECVKACADSHDDVTRLVLEGNRFNEYLVPSACRSCHDPACLVGCPVDAIHRKSSKTGGGSGKSMAIVIENHCIGCGLCSHNCPFGSIHMYEPEAGKRKAASPKRVATNCDLCESLDGNPRCVYNCPHDAAVRMTGFELSRLVGLQPLGSVQDEAKLQSAKK